MITDINHVTLAVSDLERAFAFYTEVLGLIPLAKWQRGTYLQAGDDFICLSQDTDARNAPHTDYSHLAFSVPSQVFDRR